MFRINAYHFISTVTKNNLELIRRQNFIHKHFIVSIKHLHACMLLVEGVRERCLASSGNFRENSCKGKNFHKTNYGEAQAARRRIFLPSIARGRLYTYRISFRKLAVRILKKL